MTDAIREQFNESLRAAISRDDTQKFKNLLYGKYGTFQLEDQYLTQRCASEDAPGCMALSIEMGQPVDLPDDQLPPLICAATVGSVETACLLIEAGADPNCVHNNDTPLMTAVRLSSPDFVTLLIEAGADLVQIEYAARYARSPSVLLPFIDNGDRDRALVEAIAAGRLENVQILLARGAVPTVRGLLIACAYNYASIVRELLDHGVVPDDVAMQTTIYWNAVDAMAELIRWGLKPIDADVHYATMHNRPRGLSFLLERKANVECEINGTLPIHVSARHGLVDCMNLLIDSGARWNASDNLGCTPMHWSAIRKNPAAMNALIARGAYVNVEEGGEFLPTVRPPTPDWSPIHVSVEGRGFEVVGILLRNKANQIPMWDGRWPLHIAVQNARVDLVRELMKYGANLAVKNLKGQTPVDLAESMERDDITEILAKGPD